jgi:threonine-phosphate decarboxylase
VATDRLRGICREHPKIRFIVDESYLSFAPRDQARSIGIQGLDNVVVLWSASKIFGIPGLRAGFLIAAEDNRRRFSQYLQPWCMNGLAQAAMVYIGDHAQAVDNFIQETRDFLREEWIRFRRRLAGYKGLILFPSVASYILLQLPAGLYAPRIRRALAQQPRIRRALAQQRILIRDCSNFEGLSNRFIRVALKSPRANRTAVEQIAATVQSQLQDR